MTKSVAQIVKFLKDLSAAEKDKFKSAAYGRAAINFMKHYKYHIGVIDLHEDFLAIPGIGSSINRKLLNFIVSSDEFQLDIPVSNYPAGLFTKEETQYLESINVLDEEHLKIVAKSNPHLFPDSIMSKLKLIRVTPELNEIVEYFTRFLSDCGIVRVCGSLRRGHRAIRDLDIVSTAQYEDLLSKFEEINKEEIIHVELINNGHQMVRDYIYHNGFRIKFDIRLVDEEEVEFAMLYLTGPHQFNIELRGMAARQGLLLNEYGLFNRETREKLSNVLTESDVFRKVLDSDFIQPADRDSF